MTTRAKGRDWEAIREELEGQLESVLSGLTAEDFETMKLAFPTSEEEVRCLAATGAGLAVGLFRLLERRAAAARKGGAA